MVLSPEGPTLLINIARKEPVPEVCQAKLVLRSDAGACSAKQRKRDTDKPYEPFWPTHPRLPHLIDVGEPR
jgi:hypothetical protein